MEVLFEDVSLPGLNFPMTFRIPEVDYGHRQPWTWDTLQVPGEHGGWVTIDRPHPLWLALNYYAESADGFGRIDDKVRRRLEIDAEVPDGIGAYKHRREYEVAL